MRGKKWKGREGWKKIIELDGIRLVVDKTKEK